MNVDSDNSGVWDASSSEWRDCLSEDPPMIGAEDANALDIHISSGSVLSSTGQGPLVSVTGTLDSPMMASPMLSLLRTSCIDETELVVDECSTGTNAILSCCFTSCLACADSCSCEEESRSVCIDNGDSSDDDDDDGDEAEKADANEADTDAADTSVGDVTAGTNDVDADDRGIDEESCERKSSRTLEDGRSFCGLP